MSFQATSAAEIRARKSFIVCIQGGCFSEDAEVIPGAADYLWQNCERIVYILESVGPRAMVSAIDHLQANGFPFVDGDKRVMIMPRRPGVSNPEFWSRVLVKARQLGGQVTVIGNEQSRLFKYLIDHPQVAKNAPRVAPDESWEKGAIIKEHRRMLVRLTDLLWVACVTAYKPDQVKYAQWITSMISKPEIVMVQGKPHLVMPPEFQECPELEDSPGGQFLKRIREFGYEVHLHTNIGTEGDQHKTRSYTRLMVNLR